MEDEPWVRSGYWGLKRGGDQSAEAAVCQIADMRMKALLELMKMLGNAAQETRWRAVLVLPKMDLHQSVALFFNISL
jgi:hypothetical protein